MRHGIILLPLTSGGVVNIQNTEELRRACFCDLTSWTTVALRAPVDGKWQQEHSGELTQSEQEEGSAEGLIVNADCQLDWNEKHLDHL